MSVPNFTKSYHTVLGAAIDFNGTRIIIKYSSINENGLSVHWNAFCYSLLKSHPC